jgi:hypothetical protein
MKEFNIRAWEKDGDRGNRVLCLTRKSQLEKEIE